MSGWKQSQEQTCDVNRVVSACNLWQLARRLGWVWRAVRHSERKIETKIKLFCGGKLDYGSQVCVRTANLTMYVPGEEKQQRLR